MPYRTLNPYTEELVREYPQATADEVEQALEAADATFRNPSWRDDLDRRLAVLTRLSELLIEHSDELVLTMATEMGKLAEEGRAEAKLCSGIAAYYADNARELLKPKPYPTTNGDAWVQYQPVGVLVAVEPWNVPIYQLIRVVAPAIAVGNTVLMKHAGIVPGCALLFERLVREAGAPEGAVTNLFVSSDQVGDLLADARVQGVALTGSEKAGAAVAARASKELKKASLELGGNDVFVVLDDADIAKAAEVGAKSRLYNCGQVCVAAKRFIVQEPVLGAFMEAFTAQMRAVTMGDPLDAQTTLGPLSSEEARDGLSRQVDAAVEHGANVLLGGTAPDRQGFFYEPTILSDISRDNPAYYEEFFGPVAQVYVVQTDDEAVELANDSHFGLGGSVFSSDLDRARTLASQIESGMVFINASTDSRPELPFGGVKRSGFGRELADLGLLEFVNKKLVVVAEPEGVRAV